MAVGSLLEGDFRFREQRASGHTPGAVEVDRFLVRMTMNAPLPPPPNQH